MYERRGAASPKKAGTKTAMRNEYDFSFELYIQLREQVGPRGSWPYGFKPGRKLMEIIYQQLGRTDALRFFTCVREAASCSYLRSRTMPMYRDHLAAALKCEFGDTRKQQLDAAWLVLNTARDITGAEHCDLLADCVIAALKADEMAPV